MLRGHVDPLNLIFPEGELTATEHLYQDSPSLRFINLLAQKRFWRSSDVCQRERCCEFELGGGTGGMTSFILPVLSENCAEYVFTDFLAFRRARPTEVRALSVRAMPDARYERDPREQGFDPHSFDLIIASRCPACHAESAQDARPGQAALGVRRHAFAGRGDAPWLNITLIFGLLKGWWLFDDDVRRDEPCISQEQWKSLLAEAGFNGTVCAADAPETRQRPTLVDPHTRSAIAPIAPHWRRERSRRRTWLVFADGAPPVDRARRATRP